MDVIRVKQVGNGMRPIGPHHPAVCIGLVSPLPAIHMTSSVHSLLLQPHVTVIYRHSIIST